MMRWKMLKNGEIAATIALAGKPAPALSNSRPRMAIASWRYRTTKRMGGDFPPRDLYA